MEVSQSTDVVGYEKNLARFANVVEFSLFSATLVIDQPAARTRFISLGNVPEACAGLWGDPQRGERDPVMQQLKRESLPVAYRQSTYVDRGLGYMWEEMAPFGFATGIATALHMPDGTHFVIGIDRSQPLPKCDAAVARLMAGVQLMAVHAREAAVRLLLPAQLPELPPPWLTTREREILQWTLDGKSAWAVGQILAISNNTVNFHLKNTMRKFGVSSKYQAALRAVTLGMLKP